MHILIFTFSVNIFQGHFGEKMLEMVDETLEVLIKYQQTLMDSLQEAKMEFGTMQLLRNFRDMIMYYHELNIFLLFYFHIFII